MNHRGCEYNILFEIDEKEKNVSGRKGQNVFKSNNGAVASPIMRREPVRS